MVMKIAYPRICSQEGGVTSNSDRQLPRLLSEDGTGLMIGELLGPLPDFSKYRKAGVLCLMTTHRYTTWIISALIFSKNRRIEKQCVMIFAGDWIFQRLLVEGEVPFQERFDF